MHKRGLCRHVVSLCLCVCPPRSWNVPKRIKIFSIFFHHRVATPFWFFHTKRHGNIRTGTLLTGTSNAGWVGENAILDEYLAAYRSTVLSTVRVANCEKHRRDGRRRASSTPRRPSSVVRTRRRQSVCDGLNVIRRRGGQPPPRTQPPWP